MGKRKNQGFFEQLIADFANPEFPGNTVQYYNDSGKRVRSSKNGYYIVRGTVYSSKTDKPIYDANLKFLD